MVIESIHRHYIDISMNSASLGIIRIIADRQYSYALRHSMERVYKFDRQQPEKMLLHLSRRQS
jgi:hypothetical protein